MPKHSAVFAIILLALATPASPQVPAATPAPAAAKPPAAPVIITGVVIDQVTRQPIRKATVNTGPEGAYRTTTADDGSYRFEVPATMPASTATVSASATGYNRGSHGAQPLPLAPGKTFTGINVELARQSVATGRVVNSKGKPVANVSVVLHRLGYIGGRRTLMLGPSDMTDDLGQYRISNLTPGDYYVSASPLTFRRDDPRPAAVDRSAVTPSVNRVTFYPGVAEEEAAQLITIPVGREFQMVDIVLLQAPSLTISGRIVNLTGSPAPAVVSLGDTGSFEPNEPQPIPLRPDGTFELSGVAPGSYTLAARNGTNPNLSDRVTLPLLLANKSLEGLELRLTPGLDIPGTLRVDSDNDPTFKLGNHQVQLTWSGLITGDTLRPAARTADDGSFTLKSVDPHYYRLAIDDMPPGYFIQSARMGGIDLVENGITLSESVPGPLHIVVSAKGGSARGIVRDAEGKPVPNATVILAPELPTRKGQAQWYRSVRAGADGSFSLLGIRPADYQLFAWADVFNNAWLNADFMRPLESKGTRVVVKENSSVTLDLKVLPK